MFHESKLHILKFGGRGSFNTDHAGSETFNIINLVYTNRMQILNS